MAGAGAGGGVAFKGHLGRVVLTRTEQTKTKLVYFASLFQTRDHF